jgi:2-amino-4-hydroxy-6-hydroxymethyldihydropteridine diphosphokinase
LHPEKVVFQLSTKKCTFLNYFLDSHNFKNPLRIKVLISAEICGIRLKVIPFYSNLYYLFNQKYYNIKEAKMNKKIHRVFLGIGANIGNCEKNILEALKNIEEANIKIVKRSSLIETEPYGVSKQPRFLNCVVETETELDALDLLHTLLKIELNMGRVRKIHWGPRVIDLDILFYDSAIIKTDDLKVPHPDIQNRIFVVEPMAEIAPNFVHPIFKRTIKELLNDLKEKKK